MVKYRFIRQQITKDSVEKLLGKKIKRLTVGQIDNGEGETANGIEVETDGTLPSADLKKVSNGLLSLGYRREE